MSDLKRILVVEDDALLLLSLVDDLTDLGFTPVAASTSRSAARLLDDSIDALITDIELGKTPTGLTLARIAAQMHPQLPIVIVSGGVTPGPEDMPHGAVFIQKPYQVSHIVRALERQRVTRAA